MKREDCVHGSFSNVAIGKPIILRKEVIQPQIPLRLPCYDLALVTSPTLILAYAGLSGRTDFRSLTGGVYKTRERIHRGMLIRDY